MSLNKALATGRYRQFSYLLRVGADVNSRGADGTTPLMLCCHLPDERVAYRATCRLLRRGADVGVKDRAGRNALLHACVTGRRAHVELFLQPGCCDYDLNDADKVGNTALHHAVVSANPDIVQLVVSALKRYGLRLHFQNNIGLTAHNLAVKEGLKECADIISPVVADFSPTQEASSRTPSPSARQQNRKCQGREFLRGKDVVFRNVSSPLFDMSKPREAFLAQADLPRTSTSASRKTGEGPSGKTTERKVTEKLSADQVRDLLLVQALDQLPTFRKTAVPPPDCDVWGRPLVKSPKEEDEASSKGRNVFKVLTHAKLATSSKPAAPPRTESEPNLLKRWKRNAFVTRRRTVSTSQSPLPGNQWSSPDRGTSPANRSRRLLKNAFTSGSASNFKGKFAEATPIPTPTGTSHQQITIAGPTS